MKNFSRINDLKQLNLFLSWGMERRGGQVFKPNTVTKREYFEGINYKLNIRVMECYSNSGQCFLMKIGFPLKNWQEIFKI